jgi:hypothetical protein
MEKAEASGLKSYKNAQRICELPISLLTGGIKMAELSKLGWLIGTQHFGN